MACYPTHQQTRQARGTMCGGRVAVVCGVLALMVACPLVGAQERPPACPAPPPPPGLSGEGGRLTAADLGTLFEHADTAHKKGDALPDPLLRPAVEAALRPDDPMDVRGGGDPLL